MFNPLTRTEMKLLNLLLFTVLTSLLVSSCQPVHEQFDSKELVIISNTPMDGQYTIIATGINGQDTTVEKYTEKTITLGGICAKDDKSRYTLGLYLESISKHFDKINVAFIPFENITCVEFPSLREKIMRERDIRDIDEENPPRSNPDSYHQREIDGSIMLMNPEEEDND